MNKLFYGVCSLGLIGVLSLALNLFGGAALVGARVDLTRHQRFTLTPGTQEILRNLAQPIDLYFFYSEKTARHQPGMQTYALRILELLEAYQAQSGQHIMLHRVDPQPGSKQAAQAAKMGLRSIRTTSSREPLYFGLAGTTGQGEVKAVAFFSQDNAARLEYELSQLLVQLTPPKTGGLGLMSDLAMEGSLGSTTGNPMPPWYLFNELERRYQVSLLPIDAEQIPPEIRVLLLVHPRRLSTATLYAIDQFVLRGGKLLVFVDPYSELDPGTRYFGVTSLDRSSDMSSLLNMWGVQMVPAKVVGDGLYGMIAGRDVQGRFLRLPTAPGLPQKALSQDDNSTAGLNSIKLSTAGVLRVLDGGTTRITPLMRSSPNSRLFDAQRFTRPMEPEELMNEFKAGEGESFVLAARIQGPAASAFADGIEGQSTGLKAASGIDVIVVADTDLLTDPLWVRKGNWHGWPEVRPWADNGDFVVNALDDFLGRDQLIRARSRNDASQPFDHLQDLPLQPFVSGLQLNSVQAMGNALKLINIVIAPMLSGGLIWLALMCWRRWRGSERVR